MNETWSAARAIAWRHLYKWLKVPANFLPTFLFPLVFFTGFAGALGSVGKIPDFGYEANYTSWIFVFSLLQTCLFGGLGTGFTIAADFQSGFMRRLMLAVSDRRAILLGYVLSTFARAAIMSALVTVVALVAGMEMLGSAEELAAMYVLALLLSICGTLWAAGVMFRARSPQMGPAMQIPMFIAVFLAPVYVPIRLLDGWLHTVARFNPITYVMEAGRALLAGHPEHVGLAALCVGGLLVALLGWSLRGVHAAEQAGG
jgi:ABC-2 type transport system permease protein